MARDAGFLLVEEEEKNLREVAGFNSPARSPRLLFIQHLIPSFSLPRLIYSYPAFSFLRASSGNIRAAFHPQTSKFMVNRDSYTLSR